MAEPKKNLFLLNLLGETEYDEFLKGLSRDQVNLKTLLKILDQRNKEVGRKDDLLDHPNYAIKRAYLDGRGKEIEWLLNQLITD